MIKFIEKKYLPTGENQDDIELQDLPHRKYPNHYKESDGYVHPCPKCKGYGKWNLLLNEYGPGKHFQCGCDHCEGWGWVQWADATHAHKFIFVKNSGPHLTVYKCETCGKIREVDSSG